MHSEGIRPCIATAPATTTTTALMGLGRAAAATPGSDGSCRRRRSRSSVRRPGMPSPRYAIVGLHAEREMPLTARSSHLTHTGKTLRQAQQIQSESKSKQMHQNRLQCGCCNPGKCLGRCNKFVGLDSCNAPSGLNSDLICRNQYFLQALAQNNQIFQGITIARSNAKNWHRNTCLRALPPSALCSCGKKTYAQTLISELGKEAAHQQNIIKKPK